MEQIILQEEEQNHQNERRFMLSDLLTKTAPKYPIKLHSNGKTIYFRPFLVREEKSLLLALEENNPQGIMKAVANIIMSCCEDIKNPMDLSTMKKKIDAHEYTSVMDYRDDIILMTENCMTYNKMDTIYYHAARKMFDYCIKLLSRVSWLVLELKS